MTQYTIVLTIPNAGNKEICYSVNHEDNIYPSDYWGDKENRLQLRQFIENVHYRKISDKDLDLIIRKFLSSIKSGFRGRIPITIDLPPIGIATPTSTPSPTPTPVSDRDRLRDNKSTSTDSNSDYPPVKTRNPPEVSKTSSGDKSQSSVTGNTRDHNGEKNQNQNPPQTETRSTNNQADF
jgi:hypothetical protein